MNIFSQKNLYKVFLPIIFAGVLLSLAYGVVSNVFAAPSWPSTTETYFDRKTSTDLCGDNSGRCSVLPADPQYVCPNGYSSSGGQCVKTASLTCPTYYTEYYGSCIRFLDRKSNGYLYGIPVVNASNIYDYYYCSVQQQVNGYKYINGDKCYTYKIH